MKDTKHGNLSVDTHAHTHGPSRLTVCREDIEAAVAILVFLEREDRLLFAHIQTDLQESSRTFNTRNVKCHRLLNNYFSIYKFKASPSHLQWQTYRLCK